MCGRSHVVGMCHIVENRRGGGVGKVVQRRIL